MFRINVKKTIKNFFQPTEKITHESLYDLIENLKNRIENLEFEQAVLLQKIQELQGKSES